jgi:hypothetical protein
VLAVAEDLQGAGFALQSELSAQHVLAVAGLASLKVLFVP